jgi:hypothetical protein
LLRAEDCAIKLVKFGDDVLLELVVDDSKLVGFAKIPFKDDTDAVWLLLLLFPEELIDEVAILKILEKRYLYYLKII